MINIFMARFTYPLGSYYSEQPVWLNFYVAEYSLKNKERTVQSVITRSFHQISLPLQGQVGFDASHEYGIGFSPIAPSTYLAPNIANNGGEKNLNKRGAAEFASATFLGEYATASDANPLRRFANITELTMISEARKIYGFSFIFAPKNNNESVASENIASTFRKCSYPTVVTGLPERTYPQNLWAITVSGPNSDINYSANFLGRPLVCVLNTVSVKKNEKADPVIRLLPNGFSNITLMGLQFTEFETGSYDPIQNEVFSKSELSARYFGYTPVNS